MIDLFEQGRTRPLPFFPNASMAWLLQEQKLKESNRAKKTGLACARDTWTSDRGGEGLEFAAALCFPENPWDEDGETMQINKRIMGFLGEGGSFAQ